MMMWGYGYSGPMMVDMLIWNLIWLGLLALGIYALVRWIIRSNTNTASTRSTAGEPSAEEILRRRYARGEIDTATFEQMRERLEAGNEPRPIERSHM